MPFPSPSAPARYFPFLKGVYDVSPGLFPLGRDFGNGAADAKVFQFDTDFPLFRANTLAARRERLDKYVLTRNLPPAAETAAARFLLDRLTAEWPEYFRFEKAEAGGGELRCALTGERLGFSPGMALTSQTPAPDPPYVSAIDALISQTAEDFAMMVRGPENDAGTLALLHVCAPSHWTPEEKIGLDFAGIHAPVPGFARGAKNAAALVSAVIDKGPYARFVWSFVTDRRLNHHPAPPPGADAEAWRGRAFDATRGDGPPFYLCVERQITLGLPEVQAGLFFIRVSFLDGREIRETPALRAPLLAALESMSPESRHYKDVADCWDELTGWLKSGG